MGVSESHGPNLSIMMWQAAGFAPGPAWLVLVVAVVTTAAGGYTDRGSEIGEAYR